MTLQLTCRDNVGSLPRYALVIIYLVTTIVVTHLNMRNGPHFGHFESAKGGSNHARITGENRRHHRGQQRYRLATARRFVKEGAYVFITGRRQAELDKAVAEIGSNVTAVQGDVANPDDLDRLYQTVAAKKGKLDILFANAGVADTGPTPDVKTA